MNSMYSKVRQKSNFLRMVCLFVDFCWSELNVKTQSAIHSSPKVQILGVKWECASRICFWKRVCWHLWVPCFEMQMRWGSPMQAKMFTSCQIMSVCSVSCQSLLCCWPAYDFIWKLHFFFCPDFVATNQLCKKWLWSYGFLSGQFFDEQKIKKMREGQ